MSNDLHELHDTFRTAQALAESLPDNSDARRAAANAARQRLADLQAAERAVGHRVDGRPGLITRGFIHA